MGEIPKSSYLALARHEIVLGARCKFDATHGTTRAAASARRDPLSPLQSRSRGGTTTTLGPIALTVVRAGGRLVCGVREHQKGFGR